MNAHLEPSAGSMPGRTRRDPTFFVAATAGLLAAATYVWSIMILADDMGGLGDEWPGLSVGTGIVEALITVCFIGFAGLTFAARPAGPVGLIATAVLSLLLVFAINPIIGHDPADVYFERLLVVSYDSSIANLVGEVFSLLALVTATLGIYRSTASRGTS